MEPRDRESTFARLNQARQTLELPERTSIRQIRDKYHELSRIWHPDHCRDKPEVCHEMQQKINEAYAVLMDYCSSYQYSFRREDVEEYPSGEDFWWEHFGEF